MVYFHLNLIFADPNQSSLEIYKDFLVRLGIIL